MGIKRKLSRLWKETRDGILRGPGVDVESVKADDATINGQLADDPRSLVGYINVEQVTSINEKIADLEQPDGGFYYDIEVLGYIDDENNADNGLTLTIEGWGDGKYDYVTETEDGVNATETGDDSATLIQPTANSGNDRHNGVWRLMEDVNSVSVSAVNYAPSYRKQGKYLERTLLTGGNLPDPFDLTISASGDALSLQLAVFRVQNRGEI